ncbi:hypothetical protein C8J57DRAFT_1302239 [Mycena rebaudengoi]|nr:hypothetical protein C8J57DRAFT_1302239 [Mycena rebaudengoi]
MDPQQPIPHPAAESSPSHTTAKPHVQLELISEATPSDAKPPVPPKADSAPSLRDREPVGYPDLPPPVRHRSLPDTFPEHILEAPPFPRPFSLPQNGSQRRSELDWIVPVQPSRDPVRPKTVEERLQPTIQAARIEREKYELKAKMTGWSLNVAIGLQVALGSLTTGLSAATSGRQTSIATTILGGLSTVVASYLARARGSNEPELSITRCKDLEQYIRECEAFLLDFGHTTDNKYDDKIFGLRERFEDLLGNANGERRLASV